MIMCFMIRRTIIRPRRASDNEFSSPNNFDSSSYSTRYSSNIDANFVRTSNRFSDGRYEVFSVDNSTQLAIEAELFEGERPKRSDRLSPMIHHMGVYPIVYYGATSRPGAVLKVEPCPDDNRFGRLCVTHYPAWRLDNDGDYLPLGKITHPGLAYCRRRREKQRTSVR